MNSAEKQAVLHCLKSMIDEAVCEECPLYGMTGTDHCENDCVRLAINALEQEPRDNATLRDIFCMGCEYKKQEPCEDVCVWFEQSIDIVTDIVEFRFSDGTVKRAKRGLYMCDVEKSLRKMLIDQIANEKKQEPCTDTISRQAAIDAIEDDARCGVYSHFASYDDAQAFKNYIKDLPPVKHTEKVGHWIVKGESWYCSRCNEPICEIYDGKPYEKYCPYCGSYNGGGDNGNE